MSDQSSAYEWRRKRDRVEGKVVECRVDPDTGKRVLLLAPEPEGPIELEVAALEAPQQVNAAATAAAGKPAMGTVKSAEVSEIPARREATARSGISRWSCAPSPSAGPGR